jgi:hypothetical protein
MYKPCEFQVSNYEANDDMAVHGNIKNEDYQEASTAPPDFILCLFMTVTCLLSRRISQILLFQDRMVPLDWH